VRVSGAAGALVLALTMTIGVTRGAFALEGSGVLLQGLDKVTARITTIEAPLNKPVHFGTLEITAKRCFKRPPEESPESAAFLEIREVREGEAPHQLFNGWMFASSPALAALEHPVYDVWVKDCLNVKSSDDSGPR
jgi:hypothetical protein